MCGCSRDSGRNGRHGRDMEGHASAPLCSLLLGDADGALHGSVLLRGPLRGNPKVAGHSAGTLAGAGHVPFVGATLLLELASSAGILPRWADSTSLLGPDFLRCS